MQVEMAHAPASLQDGGQRVYFCSDHCAQRFTQRSAPAAVPAHDHSTTNETEEHTMDRQRMMERLDAMAEPPERVRGLRSVGTPNRGADR
jgi:YHS domain-containing protein